MDTMLLGKSDGALHTWQNRPDKRNALNDDILDELVETRQSSRDDTEHLAIVVSGTDRSFCPVLDFTAQRPAVERADEDADDPNSAWPAGAWLRAVDRAGTARCSGDRHRHHARPRHSARDSRSH